MRPLIGSEKGQDEAWSIKGNSLFEIDEMTGDVKKESQFSFMGIYNPEYTNQDVYEDSVWASQTCFRTNLALKLASKKWLVSGRNS